MPMIPWWQFAIRESALSTFCLEAIRTTLPNLARGVANRMDSASWDKFSQPTFSFICCRLPYFCRRFLQFALHFRDSIAIQPNAERRGRDARRNGVPRSADYHRLHWISRRDRRHDLHP